jgi:hypothetical protein
MSSRPRKASFLCQNVEMLWGLFLCTVGGNLRCGIHLGVYQAHQRFHDYDDFGLQPILTL